MAYYTHPYLQNIKSVCLFLFLYVLLPTYTHLLEDILLYQLDTVQPYEPLIILNKTLPTIVDESIETSTIEVLYFYSLQIKHACLIGR